MRTDKRPVIIGSEPTSLELESFQNETIRPIFKQISNVPFLYFNSKKQGLRLPLAEGADLQYYFKSLLDKDHVLKNRIIGMVVGGMDEKEMKKYLEREKEWNKRIVSIVLKRIAELNA